jgi:salicylate synthetase
MPFKGLMIDLPSESTSLISILEESMTDLYVKKFPVEQQSMLPMIERLLHRYAYEDHFVYERGLRWYVGIGAKASLTIDADGKQAAVFAIGTTQRCPVNGTLAEAARKFISQYGSLEGRIFGHAGFNDASHVNGDQYRPGTWPLLALMLPEKEVVFDESSATIYSADEVNWPH